MLDADLANIYECKNGTKEINQAVKNNIEKFPERFSWILTDEENYNLRSKILTANISNMSRVNPRVFTEQGVWMLSTILKTKIATKTTIKIMDAFVLMRKYISNNLIKQNNVNNMLVNHENRITLLENTFDKFREKKKVNEIYFKGQIYDAYSKIIDILKEAKYEIIIIDSFLDKSILDMVRNINAKVVLITSIKSKLKETDIKKYQLQYTNLDIKYDNTFHDRYIIIDKNTTYHLGASINHAGSKTFSINILEDSVVKDSLLNKVFAIN